MKRKAEKTKWKLRQLQHRLINICISLCLHVHVCVARPPYTQYVVHVFVFHSLSTPFSLCVRVCMFVCLCVTTLPY